MKGINAVILYLIFLLVGSCGLLYYAGAIKCSNFFHNLPPHKIQLQTLMKSTESYAAASLKNGDPLHVIVVSKAFVSSALSENINSSPSCYQEELSDTDYELIYFLGLLFLALVCLLCFPSKKENEYYYCDQDL